jgi:acyl-CoA dehydrogenase
MRLIGLAERSLEALCRRVQQRVAFGKPLAEQGTLRADIAESRIEIEQARLLTLKAAYLMDTVGAREARAEIAMIARAEIAMIKVAAPTMALRVIDRAIQAHGAAGVSADFGLAAAWAHARTLRLADGPDEVHRETIARLELRRST